MIKRFPHRPEMEQEAANVFIYVYDRVRENIANDIILINEVFESNYFALSKRISSSSLDVYLHFQTGDQAFKNIKKYFEITQTVHHRWLDVIKAAIELDISLSLEENLLSSSISDDNIVSLHNLSYGVLEALDNEFECKIHDSDIILPVQASSLGERIESFLENIVKRQDLAPMNPEIIIQQFEGENEAGDIRQKTKIKSITISDSSHLNVLRTDCHSFCQFQVLHSNVRKTHLFTTSQQLSRVTHTFSRPIKSLRDENLDDDDELDFPDLHFPSIETSDSTFIKLSSLTSPNNFNEQYSNSSCGPNLANMEYTTCDGGAEMDTLGTSIRCLLPIKYLSNSQEKLISQINIGQVRHISILSCHVNHGLKQNLLRKSCSTTESMSSCNHSIIDQWNPCSHESCSDIHLHATDNPIHPLCLCTPIRVESENISNNFLLISSYNFICPSLGILVLSPSCSLFSSFLVEQFCFNENQLVKFQDNEPLQLISELPSMNSKFSICSENLLNEIHFHYWSIKNSKDIGYMSYFRSFTLPIRKLILRNRQCLPCSKDLRLFSTSFQRFQCSSFISVNDQSLLKEKSLAHQLEQSMNIENQMLQSKYFALPQLLEKQSGEILLKPVDYFALREMDNLYKNFLGICINCIVNEYFNELKGVNSETNCALDYLQKTCIYTSSKGDQLRESKIIILPQSERYRFTADPLFSSIIRNACLYPSKINIPNQEFDIIKFPESTKAVILSRTSFKIDEELRCLNLIVYFLEELFDIWKENMVSMAEVQNILNRLFSQLRVILLSISRKKNLDKLTKLCSSCVEEIESSLNYAFDAVCVLLFLKSILHKLNSFGKFILSYNIIPMSLKYSLFKLFLRYKTVLNKQKRLKLHACLIEVHSNPNLLESLFNCSSSDRRIRYIEKKSNCSMVLQPPISSDERRRLIKVYCTSDEENLNVKSIISIITSTLNKPFSKIQITAAQSLTESENKFSESDLHLLGEVRWSSFRYI